MRVHWRVFVKNSLLPYCGQIICKVLASFCDIILKTSKAALVTNGMFIFEDFLHPMRDGE
jgi:hypothetical protein